ncbi:unnamed protein product [Brassicogethes aeneus]|uniref:Cystathionine beta-synthase n=1 Tax=Brassicogethes aeneus TaxID=1431903 RepID=A0A9P0AXI7_BRAAE|nr:unnamed protein product [Brassicogethes aeneus]
MSESTENHCTNQKIKQLKTNLSFWSPLNNSFAVPDKPSKCTWHKKVCPTASPHRTQEWKRTSKLLPNVLSTIGNTPLIKLNKIPKDCGVVCDIYVKCEFFNPGGSVKDRIGYRMVEDAEKQGILKPGATIIEPSSGNTGIGIALAAAVKGYRCLIVMSEKMSNEKVSVLNALGAEIVRTPVTADSDSPDGMFGVTHRLKNEIANSVILDQYSNPGNSLAHYDTTAEEILDQCDGNVDMIVIGTGTGGTISGIGRKIKEKSPNTVIVGADPEGSILALPAKLNETDVGFYEVEGVGYDFLPTVLDRSVVDKWVKTNDKDSLPMARRLIRDEGLLCGSSSGANLSAAIIAAKDLKPGQRVVVILPDSIRNYITKFISDQWMEARDFQPCVNTKNHWWWDVPVTTIPLEKLQTATPSMTCERVLNVMKKLGVDQVPLVDNNSIVIGMITLQNLMNGLISGRVQSNQSIESIVMRIYPKVYTTANLGVISRVLEKESYVMILEKQANGDKPVGIVTAIDLLKFISESKPAN